MVVKRTSAGARILSVLDAVARNQPIGVSKLSRLLEDDKSTVQRMLMTLADEGWIRNQSEGLTAWCVTERLRVLADIACTGADLRTRAKTYMESLRDQTKETVSLVARDGPRFIVTDVVESSHIMRVAPRVGQVVPEPASASALAYLPYLAPAEQVELLGEPLTDQMHALLRSVHEKGYAVKETGAAGDSLSVAASVRNENDRPLAALVVSAPAVRLPARQRNAIGRLVRDAAQALSSSLSAFGPATGRKASAA